MRSRLALLLRLYNVFCVEAVFWTPRAFGRIFCDFIWAFIVFVENGVRETAVGVHFGPQNCSENCIFSRSAIIYVISCRFCILLCLLGPSGLTCGFLEPSWVLLAVVGDGGEACLGSPGLPWPFLVLLGLPWLPLAFLASLGFYFSHFHGDNF